MEEEYVHLRLKDKLPPAGLRQDSPYYPEAHYGNKRTTTWTGYKVYLKETCEEYQLHVITHVETTQAVLPDSEMTAAIHEALAAKQMLPKDHLVLETVEGAAVSRQDVRPRSTHQLPAMTSATGASQMCSSAAAPSASAPAKGRGRERKSR